MEVDVGLDPVDVSLFSAAAVVQVPDAITHLIEQATGGWWWDGAGLRA